MTLYVGAVVGRGVGSTQLSSSLAASPAQVFAPTSLLACRENEPQDALNFAMLQRTEKRTLLHWPLFSSQHEAAFVGDVVGMKVVGALDGA